jgi:hypothetical protein
MKNAVFESVKFFLLAVWNVPTVVQVFEFLIRYQNNQAPHCLFAKEMMHAEYKLRPSGRQAILN